MMSVILACGFVCLWILVWSWLINRSEAKLKEQIERINKENKTILKLISTMLAEEKGEDFEV